MCHQSCVMTPDLLRAPRFICTMVLVWNRAWGPPFRIRSTTFWVPAVTQGSKVPLSASHLLPWISPDGEMDEGHIELEQPNKQTENKMLVKGKISSNKYRSVCVTAVMLRQYGSSTNGTARCSLTLKTKNSVWNKKRLFKNNLLSNLFIRLLF